jgi:N-methylhydantoinase B
MGGRVPGGNATDSTEIFQEGLRIPPSRIVEAGEPNATLLNIIEANVRVPDKVMGDVRAQLASLHLAGSELTKLIGEHGADGFPATRRRPPRLHRSARPRRDRKAAVRDGRVHRLDRRRRRGRPSGQDPRQADGGEDRVAVDFSGTSPQTSGAINPNFWFTASCTYAAIRSVLDRSVPNNAGLYRAITVTAPEGSFVNPRFRRPSAPAASRATGAARGQRRASDPDAGPDARLPGRLGVRHRLRRAAPDGRPFLFLEFHNTTGIGGYPDEDGQDAGPWCLTNVANVPVEVIEAENPIRVEEYGFLPDTGGTGRHRGALGIVRQYRVLSDGATVQLRSDRQRHGAWAWTAGARGRGGGAS